MMYRLALQMGRLDVDAMLEEMTSVQASKWVAFFRASPSDATRAGAQVSSVLANVMGGGQRQWRTEDFLPARPIDGDVDPEMVKALLMGVSPGDGPDDD